jgi:hypothetical protein
MILARYYKNEQDRGLARLSKIKQDFLARFSKIDQDHDLARLSKI